jgi:DNA-binding NtrC family response regulator
MSGAKAKILVVDDDPDIITMLRDWLAHLGYDMLTASDGNQGFEVLEQQPPDVLLLDLEMPELSGLDVLKRLKQLRESSTEAPNFPVIIMTAHGTIARAVEAMKEGAYDFITKPFDMDHLSIVLDKALERESLKRQVAWLRSEVDSRYSSIIGSSPKTKAVLDTAQRAAQADISVLVLGESGTGKELFARSIHQWSPRREMPFVVINCVALTETLLENELFGHEKGAFTGADRLQKGKIELADGGTIFLDEIGDMPLPLQAKLLRVLQDHAFQRVGGTREIRVNIRVIAATNKDLRQAVKMGTFREDLFFRLNVVMLTLPPLRERSEDIPALAEYFLNQHALEIRKMQMRLAEEAIRALQAYPWPGNVRELDNVIARAVVLSTKPVIGPDSLGLCHSDAGLVARDFETPYARLPYHESMEEHSRHIIIRALEESDGSQKKAAERLKLQATYLARLIRQKNIKKRTPGSSESKE